MEERKFLRISIKDILADETPFVKRE